MYEKWHECGYFSCTKNETKNAHEVISNLSNHVKDYDMVKSELANVNEIKKTIIDR